LNFRRSLVVKVNLVHYLFSFFFKHMSSNIPIGSKVDILRCVYVGGIGRITRQMEYFFLVKLMHHHLEHYIGHEAHVWKTNVRLRTGNTRSVLNSSRNRSKRTTANVAAELWEMRDHIDTLIQMLDDLNL
jgi:hypothetical protein